MGFRVFLVFSGLSWAASFTSLVPPSSLKTTLQGPDWKVLAQNGASEAAGSMGFGEGAEQHAVNGGSYHYDEEDSGPYEAYDEFNMRQAIEIAQSEGGEHGSTSAYPLPTTGAVLVAADGTVLGKGRSNYMKDSIQTVMEDTGLEVTPLDEWEISWPSSAKKLKENIAGATLYLTLEPTTQQRGLAFPPMTELVQKSGVGRVVIGCQHPIPELSAVGATNLYEAGIEVTMGAVLEEECQELIEQYSARANGKYQRMARSHFDRFQRPLGLMHCSVVDSDNLEAFANLGNAFGKEFDGKRLSFRDFGAYEIAPPPEVIWADDPEEDDGLDFDQSDETDDIFSLEFSDEEMQESLGRTPIMPWYEQADAVVATLPPPGARPVHDASVSDRLNGLKWLATHGTKLPPGVERVLVMDSTDLKDLPLTNDHPNVPRGVDIESFWAGKGRKPTRVLLRRGRSDQAQGAAVASAKAAEAAAAAAAAATEAIETGDAERAADSALESQKAATAATELVQKELTTVLRYKRKLVETGAIVETLMGGEPVDAMKHLGQRNGYSSVVWRAGCWGNHGVQSIMDGAFQWVSAHLAVDAKGGKFWQLMLAERAVQGACGPESKVQVFADQEDISLEYCDKPEADSDCAVTVDGRPVRHVRLDCRVAIMDQN